MSKAQECEWGHTIMVMITPITSPLGASATQRRKRKKKGGWRERKVLLRKEAKQVRHALKVIRPNILVSINLRLKDGETIAERKRRHGKEVSKIGTIFRRQKCPFYAVATYEYPKEGNLHCHLALHAPKLVEAPLKQWLKKIGVWTDDNAKGVKLGIDVHARPYRRDHACYMTKEAQWPCKPSDWRSTEADKFRRQSGVAFKGKRFHFTKDTKKIIGLCRAHFESQEALS